MTDPRRLIDEGATEFEAKLLAAGQRDAVSQRSRRRVLAGLGLSAAFGASAASSSASAVTAGLLTGVKWIGICALGGLGIWGGTQLLERNPERRGGAATISQRSSLPQNATQKNTAQSKVDAIAAAPVSASATPAGFPPTPTRSSIVRLGQRDARRANSEPPQHRVRDTLRDELAMLDEARKALAGGDANRALRLLDDHGRVYPVRRLGAEATVMRIEALRARGDLAQAASIGERFLAQHPNGPYATRVRSLIGAPSR
jgi:hypothetical protein